MSQSSFQNSVSLLLRFPLPERPEAIISKAFSAELTYDERLSLENLAQDDEFNKYGREQRSQRWKATAQKISLLWDLLDEEDLYDIWLQEFEIKYPNLESDLASASAGATRAFLNFLKNDPPSIPLRYGVNSLFLVDLLDFLDHQIELAQYVIASPPALSHVSSGPTDPKMQPSPPFYSLERTFRTLKLNHDIISFVENLQDSDRSQETPPIITRPTNVVMVHRGPETLPRIFEVSSELSTLLDSMLSGELKNFIHPINQEIKNDLKAMGLLLSDESFFREH